MTASLPTGLLLLAVHGNPGFPKDFDPLFAEPLLKGFQTKALAASGAVIETALRASNPDDATIIGYSWGAYVTLQTLLRDPSLQPKHVFLVAPFLAPEENLSSFASGLLRTPLVGDLVVGVSWKKWKAGLVDRMFHTKDHEAAKHYLARLEDSKVWKQVIERKLLQQDEPLERGKLSAAHVHVIFGENDRITDRLATENLLRGFGIHFDVTTIAGAEHGLPWTHTASLAAEIARILAASKGSQP